MEVNQKRQEFVEKILHLPSKSYYAAVKQLSGPDVKKAWSVTELFPGSPDAEVGKLVLDYFAGIGGDTAPSPLPAVPVPLDAGLGNFDSARVLKLLQKHKKTTSTVPGDPMPHLVQRFPSDFAAPVAAIFNEVNRTSTWPSTWKKEYLTIIPKTPRPGSLSECRNISCTSYLSKVLEGVVLEKLRSELAPDPDQFGGLRGCGAEHMMVELWDRILRVMDDGDQAACLLGIDFEKAFNRMDHGHCLRQLKVLGASDGSLALVASFLSGRTMSININGVNCGERCIIRGSPQGSVLGCLLYCITTQTLTVAPTTEEINVLNQPMATDDPPPVNLSEDSQPEGWPRAAGHLAAGRLRFFPGSDSDGGSSEGDIRFWERDSDLESSGGDELLPEIETVKYVDDTTLFQSVPMSTAVRHISTGPTTETLRPLELEGGLQALAGRAEEIGMRVNVGKTQLLCISPANGCVTSAAIKPGAVAAWIESGQRMKLVGFTFGPTPSAGYHVDAIREDYRAKVWMLFHLHESGIRGDNLYKLYCCYIRSRIEYMSVAYHSMLLSGQAEALERLHRYALRVCFGFDRDIRTVMAEKGIEHLHERRGRRVDSFITKAANNPRFAHWFPGREAGAMELRRTRKIQETRSKTTRRHNGPLAYMKRRANELDIFPRGA